MPVDAQLSALPLLEVHAHLNGSLTKEVVKELANWKEGVPGCEDLIDLELPSFTELGIHDFFPLFSRFIYRLTDTARAVTYATVGVLEWFEGEGVVYLELRTTPRAVPETGMTTSAYVDAVLAGFAEYTAQGGRRMLAKLILCADRRHSVQQANEIVDLAIAHKRSGDGVVVGIDVCGDPTKGDARELVDSFGRAKAAGLGITVHLGEIPEQIDSQLLDFDLLPDRLGHATFLSPSSIALIKSRKIAIEICITSNVLCKTVPSVEEHHFRWAVEQGIPVFLCTDDSLVFRCTPRDEYKHALSLLPNKSLEELYQVVLSSLPALFCSDQERKGIEQQLTSWRATYEAR